MDLKDRVRKDDAYTSPVGSVGPVVPEGGRMIQEMKFPRREKRKAGQRQEMLETALALFSEKGYHNVSMHEIADKRGIRHRYALQVLQEQGGPL